jgi:tert-butyl alcohol monooxygenase / tert-amyl alcohol desaturase
VVSQRPIAIHALEHPTSGDVGVYMYRRILRDAVRGASVSAHPVMMHERARHDLPMHSYTQNTTLNLRRRETDEEDKRLIREIGRRIVNIMSRADDHLGEQRNSFVRDELEAIEREYQ